MRRGQRFARRSTIPTPRFVRRRALGRSVARRRRARARGPGADVGQPRLSRQRRSLGPSQRSGGDRRGGEDRGGADRVRPIRVTYALIEIANPSATLAAGRQTGSAASRRAALSRSIRWRAQLDRRESSRCSRRPTRRLARPGGGLPRGTRHGAVRSRRSSAAGSPRLARLPSAPSSKPGSHYSRPTRRCNRCWPAWPDPERRRPLASARCRRWEPPRRPTRKCCPRHGFQYWSRR